MVLNYTDLNWQKCQKEVLKLQRKIIVAWKEKDLQKVYLIQEILVNKLAARALAVRKVTSNKGAQSPGLDKIVIRTDKEKMELINLLKDLKDYKASPVKRVMIPKSNGKMRPLGIPSIFDRCVQALYHLALDPIAEELADSRSYGFRKNRSTQDLQQYVRAALNQKDAARYIMDADIKGFFDNISHDWLMKNIPMNKYILNQWLKAGYFYEKKNAIYNKRSTTRWYNLTYSCKYSIRRNRNRNKKNS